VKFFAFFTIRQVTWNMILHALLESILPVHVKQYLPKGSLLVPQKNLYFYSPSLQRIDLF
jgi:hypothetical protein